MPTGPISRKSGVQIPPGAGAEDFTLAGMFSLIAAWGLWSMDPVVVYLIGGGVPRILLVGIASLMGGLVMAYPGHRFLRRLKQMSGKHLLLLFVLIFFCTAMSEMLYVTAIRYMNPALVGVILRSQIAFAVLLAMFFLGERLNRITLMGIGLILLADLGMLMGAISSPGDGEGGNSVLGWVMAFGATILWSVGTIASKTLLKVVRPVELTAIRMGGAGILMLLLSFSIEGVEPITQLTAKQWGLFAIKGLVISAGFPLYYFGLRRMEVYLASAVEQISPLFTLAMVYFFLHKSVGTSDLVSVAVLLTGSFIVVFGHTLAVRKQRLQAAATAAP